MAAINPQVSIIIVNYNTFEFTCKCVQSILEKTKGCSYEIIVVDNASAEVAIKGINKLFPSVTLLESEVNLGFAKGNNMGIRYAKGDFILLLNSDAELQNDAVSICLNFLRQEQLVAAVSGALKYPDGRIQHNCQRFPSIKYKLFELFRLQKVFSRVRSGKMLLGFFFNHSEVVYPDWVWGTFFMFERKLLSLLPEQKLADDFFMYVEDIQWCMEFRKLGYSIAFQPAALVTHHMGKSGGAKSVMIDENMNKFMEAYYSPWERKLIKLLDRILLKK
ncbi:glycosyltransferase family 2 protein [Ohtaekwangia kribbensis]|uniref:Glycosyltransferase family 2 protein n=1 Tax=Ohtaekwangia kribbensis TaxID=688913 RepID=A0ABW3K4K8_9BACT